MYIDPRVRNPENERLLRLIEQRDMHVGEEFFLALPSGIVMADSHIVIHENKIFTESFRALGALKDAGFREVSERAYDVEVSEILDVDRVGIVLGIQTNKNYFHWLLEAMPRLLLAREHGFISNESLIIAPPLQTWMLNILNHYGFSKSDIFTIKSGSAARFSKLLVPARGIENIRTFCHHSKLVIDDIPRDYSMLGSQDGRRLFISRSESSSRRILNEGELFEIAERFGFERVFPERLDFEGQINLFRDATHVTGALGAGLTNIIFTKPRSLLMELAPEGRSGDANLFHNMANFFDKRFSVIVGPADTGQSYRPGRADFTIPAVAFQEALEAQV